MQRYVIFSLPATILLAAVGMKVLRKWNIGLVLVIALSVTSIPTIAKDYRKPLEDWRGASHTVLGSAAPGDAVVFFPFYTRMMLDYYRDQYGPAAPPVHIFAPGYYDGGEDVRDLLKAIDSSPHQFRHVWVLVADHGAGVQSFDYGIVLSAKLGAAFGPPTLHRFAGVEVLEYGQ